MGIKNATGDYFCWLSSDDIFYPEKTEVQLDFE
ncbi:glycosyltransferase [Peribacillus frigoritolerans]